MSDMLTHAVSGKAMVAVGLVLVVTKRMRNLDSIVKYLYHFALLR
jgi:hypothetical protein